MGATMHPKVLHRRWGVMTKLAREQARRGRLLEDACAE